MTVPERVARTARHHRRDLARAVTAEAGLSLGDPFCLALARRDGLPAFTADKQWRTVADAAGVTVAVIR